jgi:Cu/Ag efflux protein CusF
MTAVLVFLFVVACLTVSHAQRERGMRKTMEEMGVKQISGEVKAVDKKEQTITVKGMRGLVVATCNERTAVKSGKEVMTCADIKEGDKVTTLTFEVVEGKNVARNILIAPPESTAPAEKKSDAPKSEEKK